MSAPQVNPDREFIQRSARWGITLAVAIGVVFALLWILKSALTPLAAAFALAYLLDPLIDRIEARRVSRSAAVLGLIVVSISVLVVAAVFVVPQLSREIGELSVRLPGYLASALGSIGPRLESTIGISLPTSVHEALEAVRSGDIALPLDSIRNVFEGLLASLTGTVGAVVGLLVVPVIAYYALVEFDVIRRWFLDLVPRRYQDDVARRVSVINDLVSGFIRGQLIVCAILATLYGIGFSLIGIDLALGIAMLAGALAIIPYVGGAVALASASALCLLQFGIDVHLMLVVGWYAFVQTLEGLLLTPRIVGRSVGIHPMAVILGLLICGDLLGFVGLLVAVPLTAVVQVFARELLDAYRSSDVYLGAPGSGA